MNGGLPVMFKNDVPGNPAPRLYKRADNTGHATNAGHIMLVDIAGENAR
jgi:hypothetical protein